MKKVFLNLGLLLTVSIAAAVFYSCSKSDDDDNGGAAETPAIQVQNEDALVQTLHADEEEASTITFTAVDDWTTSVDYNDGSPSASGLRSTMMWVTITPDRGGAGTYNISISLQVNATGADRWASVNIYCAGKVTTITVSQRSVTANGTVPPPTEVLINGVIWSTRNVDAVGKFVNKPEDSGKLYQWNNIMPRNDNSSEPYTLRDNNSGWTTWQRVNDPSPTGWRVPTAAEMKSLEDSYAVTKENMIENGVKGTRFTDKATGRYIFIPNVLPNRLTFMINGKEMYATVNSVPSGYAYEDGIYSIIPPPPPGQCVEIGGSKCPPPPVMPIISDYWCPIRPVKILK